MNRMRQLVSVLKKKEPDSIARVMAFMSYNSSIGRVLRKGGVEIFQSMAVFKVHRLSAINSLEAFDRFHQAWLNQFIKLIQSNQGKKCSVGQAQKAINVFLKVYVDWARLPNRRTAGRLVPWIHVPLDSILMKSIVRRFKKLKKFKKSIKEILATRKSRNYSHSLSKIEWNEYECWQRFFRHSYPAKPIIFDIIWAIER